VADARSPGVLYDDNVSGVRPRAIHMRGQRSAIGNGAMAVFPLSMQRCCAASPRVPPDTGTTLNLSKTMPGMSMRKADTHTLA
jgi:hypothetical protein